MLATLVVGALVLSACGSSGSSTTAASGASGATGSTGSTSGGDVTAFCDKVKELDQLDSTFNTLSPNDLDGAKTAFSDALGKIQEVDDVTPTEVKPDVDAVVTAFSTINDAIQGVDSPEALKALGPSLKGDVQALQTNVQALKSFTSSNCK